MELRWSKKGDMGLPTNIAKIHGFWEILCSILECAAGAEKNVFCRNFSQNVEMAGETTAPMRKEEKARQEEESTNLIQTPCHVDERTVW